MELIPAETPSAPPSPKPAKYACAMMCIPPVDKPGKCPVCGMDMVPVEESTGSAGDDTTTVSLSPRAQKLAQLTLAPVERREVALEVRLFGKIAFDETRQRAMTARVPGRLDRLFVDYTGVRVMKGDHLLRLYSPELSTAQDELLQAVKGVKESDAIGIPALREAALQAVQTTRAKLLRWGLTPEQLEEIERLTEPSSHVTLFAPIGGVVTEKHVVEGMYVEMGERLFTITDLSQVWAKLQVYESDLNWLRYGQDVDIHVDAYPGEIFGGKVAFIDPVIDPRTRTAGMRVNIPNVDGRLKPEMFVHATVRSIVTADGKVVAPQLAGKWICPMHPEVVEDHGGACSQCEMALQSAEALGYAKIDVEATQFPVVIPATAPLLTGKRAIVYVAMSDAPGTYEGREVELGPRAGEFFIVRSGLSEGDTVVAHGALRVDSAAQILGRKSMMNLPQSAHDPLPAKSEPTAAVGIDFTNEQARIHFHNVFREYHAIHDGLARDQLHDAVQSAKRLLEVATVRPRAHSPSQSENALDARFQEYKAAAERISTAQTIGAARAAFETLSNGLIAVVKQSGAPGPDPLRLYHCPMAFNNRGADWLQSSADMRNPYFGAEMLTCGVLKEMIQPRAAGPQQGE